MESKFGLRVKDAEKHWQTFQLENFKITKPLIVCLSGDATNTELEANGLCKLVEGLLENDAQDVDLMGVAYGEKNGLNNYKLSDNDIEKFVNNLLIPLCEDKRTNKIFTIEECCRKLSLITFFTFCHGSKEVSNILTNFKEKLIKKGFTEQNVELLTQSLLEVSYAKETENVTCPQVYFASADDSIGPIFNHWYFGDMYSESLHGSYAMLIDKPGQFCGRDWIRPETKQFASITIIADTILKSGLDINDEAVVSEEHKIGYFKDTDKLNKEGKILRKAMSECLKERVKNSIQNKTSNNYEIFYLKKLYSKLEKELPAENRVDNTIHKINV